MGPTADFGKRTELLRYRVTGFVTYQDDCGKRRPIPPGETVGIVRATTGGGTMTWRDPSGRSWSEALSERLLLHYTRSQLELVAPSEPPPRAAQSQLRRLG